MALMASGLSPQMVWAFCAAVWQSPLCHWSRPSTPCSLGHEWEWINQMVWERSANLMHFVSRSPAAEPRQDLRRYLQPEQPALLQAGDVALTRSWSELWSVFTAQRRSLELPAVRLQRITVFTYSSPLLESQDNFILLSSLHILSNLTSASFVMLRPAAD